MPGQSFWSRPSMLDEIVATVAKLGIFITFPYLALRVYSLKHVSAFP